MSEEGAGERGSVALAAANSDFLPKAFATLATASPPTPDATTDAAAATQAPASDDLPGDQGAEGAEGAGAEGGAVEAAGGEGEGAAAPVAPAEDPRIAQMQSQITALNEQLTSARGAKERAQVSQDLQDLQSDLNEAKEFLGEDSQTFKVLDRLGKMVSKALDKAEEAQGVTVARDSSSAHQSARTDSPVTAAIYAADATGDTTAGIHIKTMQGISQAILDEQGLETIDWHDHKSLKAHYGEVEKRFNEMVPGARARYFPGPKGVPAPNPGPRIREATVRSPETLGTIPGGVGPRPTEPTDVTKMSPIERAMYASASARKPLI